MTKKKSADELAGKEPHGFHCELCDSVFLANMTKKEYALRFNSLGEFHKSHGYTRLPDQVVVCPVCMEGAEEYPLDDEQPEAMKRMISLASDFFGKDADRENKYDLKEGAGFRVYVCVKCGAVGITEMTDTEFGMRFSTHGKPGYPPRYNLECPICIGDMWNTHDREGTSRNLEKLSTPLIVRVAKMNRGVKKR